MNIDRLLDDLVKMVTGIKARKHVVRSLEKLSPDLELLLGNITYLEVEAGDLAILI